MTNRYHANPYDISAIGFYFSTHTEYLEKSAKHRNEFGDPVEEYEIQFIDGNSGRLFNALSVSQADLEQWFDDFDGLRGKDVIKAVFLAEVQGYAIISIIDQLDDVVLFEGTAVEYAEEYLEDSGLLDKIPVNLRYYFDTQAYARDMVMDSDITEFEFEGRTYIVQVY